MNKTVVPARLLDYTEVTNMPYWIDGDGNYWTDINKNLSKSIDKGVNYTTVIAAPDTYAAIRIIVSDTGRVLWVTPYKVYILSIDQTTWTLQFEVTNSPFAPQFGFDKYKNIMLLSNYSNTAVEVHASFDGGLTWAKIYNGYGTIVDAGFNYHCHTVAYDPWADRIIVCSGDEANRQTLYSDDKGVTWIDVYPSRGFKYDPQPTMILPSKYGVLFGSDNGSPRYLSFWKRSEKYARTPISYLTIDYKFYQFSVNNDDIGHPRTIWHDWLTDTSAEPTFVFSVNPESIGKTVKLFMSDGLNVWEIWRLNEAGTTLRLIFDKAEKTLYFETVAKKYKFELPEII